MMKDSLPSIDEMIKLAQTDPEALEKIRLEAIEELIGNAPEHFQRRLRGLQFEIDCKRRIHKSPLGACISISTMMLDSLNRLNEALHGMQENAIGKEPKPVTKKRGKPASLIRFPEPEVVEL